MCYDIFAFGIVFMANNFENFPITDAVRTIPNLPCPIMGG